MIEDVVALVKERLDADTVLSAFVPAAKPTARPVKVGTIIMGARLTKNPTPPYIRINCNHGRSNGNMEGVVVELRVVADSSGDRNAISRRIRKALQHQRLAKPGLVVLRLLQASVRDNVTNFDTGGVMLVVLYSGEAVITDQLLGP